MKKEDPYIPYLYELIDNETIQIYFPEQYFFPAFLETIEKLKKEEFYTKVKRIILDQRECKSLHGIGMSSEIQNFYADSKVENKDVYWVGNPELHKVIKIMMADYFEEIIPYYSSIEEIIK